MTGAAGAYGGYVVQLAKADGLTVVADASEADEAAGGELGADVVVRRGDDVAARIREVSPTASTRWSTGRCRTPRCSPRSGTAARSPPCAATGATRARASRSTRSRARVAEDHAALDRLRRQVEEGVLTLRVAADVSGGAGGRGPPPLEGGGVRGRLVLEF